MRELKTSRSRQRSERWMDRYVRRNVRYAFSYGSWVSIRQQMRQMDPDSIPCPRCWSETHQRAKDPNCPMCYGGAWVHPETMDGYRPRILTRAHVGETLTEFKSLQTGTTLTEKQSFWIQYTDSQFRDGDLVALVEPENVDDAKFLKSGVNEYTRFRQNNIILFEVISSEHPTLHPGSQSTEGNMIIAQRVNAQVVLRESPEWNVDMGANLPLCRLLNQNPSDYFADENLIWMSERAYA